MGPLPRWTRFRQWLAVAVILKVLWFVLGEKPLFCDWARDCPLERRAL